MYAPQRALIRNNISYYFYFGEFSQLRQNLFLPGNDNYFLTERANTGYNLGEQISLTDGFYNLIVSEP